MGFRLQALPEIASLSYSSVADTYTLTLIETSSSFLVKAYLMPVEAVVRIKSSYNKNLSLFSTIITAVFD